MECRALHCDLLRIRNRRLAQGLQCDERTTILGYGRLLFRATIWHRDEYPTIKTQPQSPTLRRYLVTGQFLSSSQGMCEW